MRYYIATLLLWNSLTVGQETTALSLKTRIPLSNVDGRMDHFAVDAKGQRLFVSALGNHTAEVLHLQAGRRLRTLADLEEPQGQFYDASANRLFVATGDGATRIYDWVTFQLPQTVKFSDDADNIRYDARNRGVVVVGYGGEKALRRRPAGSGVLAFLDANGKQSGEIVVDAHPESFQLEKNGTRVSVNVRDRKEIQVADVVKGTNLARWPTTVAEDPDRYDRIARYPMPAGTRTSLFVPEWGRLFAAVPHRGIQGSGILVYEAN